MGCSSQLDWWLTSPSEQEEVTALAGGHLTQAQHVLQLQSTRPCAQDTPNEEIGGGLASLAHMPDINSAQDA